MVRVNFADVPEFSNLPAGRYHLRVTDGEVAQTGEDAKFPDVDFWRLETTVQDGELQGKKEFITCMLPPEYEPFTLAAILRATVGQHKWTEEEVATGDADVELDDMLDLEFIAAIRPSKKNKEFNSHRFEPYDEDEWDADDILPG